MNIIILPEMVKYFLYIDTEKKNNHEKFTKIYKICPDN